MSAAADILTSTISTVGGTALGGVFRLVPEAMKFFDRKADRVHERAMFDLQLKADAQRSAEQLAVLQQQHLTTVDAKELDVLQAAVMAQGQRTGVPFADGLNALVRPLLTLHWGVFIYTAVLWARFTTLQQQGVAATEAIQQLWGPPEYALVSSMFAFWFVDRSLRRGGGVGPAR